MELRDYLTLLRKRWLSVATVTVLGVVGAVAAIALQAPTYRSNTELYISSQSGDSLTELNQGGSYTLDSARGYSRIATSPLVLYPVIAELGLDVDPATLADSISAAAPQNTPIITIGVTATDPGEAQQIADAVGRSLTARLIDIVPEGSDGTPSIKITTIKEASLPTVPVAPSRKILLALGVLLGLAGGLGLAVLREQLDTRVRSEPDVRALVDVPVLGRIDHDPAAVRTPLVVPVDAPGGPHDGRVEAFRHLRTNLQFVRAASRPRTIAVTSSIPAEGKSTTAANLALTLAASGLDVCLVEADLRRPRLGEFFGLEGAVGTTTVLIGDIDLDDALHPWGDGRLQLLLSGQVPPNPSELLGTPEMRDIIDRLAERFDTVIVDCPPLLPVTDAVVVSTLTDATLLVVGSGRVRRDEVTHALEALGTVGTRPAGVILTMTPPTRTRSRYDYASAVPAPTLSPAAPAEFSPVRGTGRTPRIHAHVAGQAVLSSTDRDDPLVAPATDPADDFTSIDRLVASFSYYPIIDDPNLPAEADEPAPLAASPITSTPPTASMPPSMPPGLVPVAPVRTARPVTTTPDDAVTEAIRIYVPAAADERTTAGSAGGPAKVAGSASSRWCDVG